MGEFLFYLTIKPIWIIFEIVFRFVFEICQNPGLSILAVSIVMNILVLPMYLRSDAMQAAEREKQKEMEDWVKRIRKTFRGDERFMILSEYYRQNDYQPYYVLKSSLSLLLQVPFFVAAYDFLSNLSILQGTSFGIIKDLGSPDGMLSLAGISINVLPILMTAINLTSAAIYTKNGTKKEKIQTTVFALVFLVLLYRSPAGLVFYWTLNNIFSLCKNIVMSLMAKHKISKEKPSDKAKDDKDPLSVKIWALSSILLALFTGLSIPLSVIESSPMDFAQTLKYSDPTRYAFLSFALGIGFFLLWGGVIFFLGNGKFKKILCRITLCCSVLAIVDHMIFSGHFGIISDTLQYDNYPTYDMYEIIFNVLFIVQAVLILMVLYKLNTKFILNTLSVLIVCVAVFSAYNISSIEKTVRSSYLFEQTYEEEAEHADINDKILKFSSKGKNVIVLMLDRAIGAYIPYIFDENPALKEKFSGFTYYPNTVSTGTETINAAGALFGGYEYAVSESNKRDDVLFKDKSNEAMKLLPKLFTDNGYHATVCDLPLANLGGFRTGSSIFNDMNNCDTHVCIYGEYNDYLTEKEAACLALEQQKRNFFFYGLTRSLPLFAQESVYDDGDYLSITCNNIRGHFITCISFLRLMPELTEVSDDSNGELIMMLNDSTHEPTLLNPPNYEPDVSIRLYEMKDHVLPDGRVMDMSNRGNEGHYDVNMATLIKLGAWMDRLRELGVYDNTKIIFVGDHGFDCNQFDYLSFDSVPVDAESMNPLLLVKDFDSKGEVITDDTFMTNADVPTIALKDVISDPVNPYTGNPINNDRKFEGPIIIAGNKIEVDAETDTVFDDETIPWYSVHDNIFNPDNWELIRPAVDPSAR